MMPTEAFLPWVVWTLPLQALRMYPPAPFTARVAKADATIGPKDTRIPAGTHVHVNILGMHYDPELFPDPEVTEATSLLSTSPGPAQQPNDASNVFDAGF